MKLNLKNYPNQGGFQSFYVGGEPIQDMEKFLKKNKDKLVRTFWETWRIGYNKPIVIVERYSVVMPKSFADSAQSTSENRFIGTRELTKH